MEQRKLGTSDILVPSICLGSMNWGQQNSEAEAHEQLDYASSEGVNFIDTAEIYPIPPEPEKQGRTELYIGSWIEKRGKRDDLILASKVSPSNILRTRSVEGTPTLDKASIREAIEGSLQRLKTDYLDLYQVHWPVRKTNFFGPRGYAHDPNDSSTSIEETLEALDEIVKEGLVRYVGVSNETPWGMNEYLRLSREKNLPRIVSIQNQYSLINRTFEVGLAEIAIKEQVPLLVYSPLSKGILTGKYLGGVFPEGARFTLFKRDIERYNPAHAQVAIQKYAELAQKHNMEPATLAIAFAASRDFVASVIIGATNLEQLKTNIEAGNITLSEEILQEIEAIHLEYPDPTS